MKLLLLVSLLVYSIQAHQLGVDESIDELHSSKDHWIAENNFLKGTKKEVLSSLVVAHSSVKDLKLRKFTEKELLLEIPEDYNTIDVYPKCTSIPVVKMQSNCGSCWAVSVAAVFSDRLCIASEGKINIQLSAEEIISCCSKCGSCKGGSTAKAWGFTKQKGLVSGGDYGSNEGCQPYSIKPCGPWSKEKCDQDIADTPKCHKHSCTNKSYKTPFRKDIHKTNKIYRISENITDIQREILINGPVVATFDVYEDFASYSRGIYRWKETSGKKIGEHSVKIVGWGKCKMCGMLYWIGSNTFGSNWGEKGFFKIMRGWNNVGFEKNVSAGLPKVHSKKHKKNNS